MAVKTIWPIDHTSGHHADRDGIPWRSGVTACSRHIVDPGGASYRNLNSVRPPLSELSLPSNLPPD